MFYNNFKIHFNYSAEVRRQRKSLLSLPAREELVLKHYIFNENDLNNIHRRSTPENKLGFALQLCALRYPGRYLSGKEVIPDIVLKFIGNQLALDDRDILNYAKRAKTRYEHLKTLQKIYGFKIFSSCKVDMESWLQSAAMEVRSNIELAEMFISECRKNKIILPGITVIERLCADAMVIAERNITNSITKKLNEKMKTNLNALLAETVDDRLSIHSWLKRFEIGSNSADINKLMDQLEYLQNLSIDRSILNDIPENRLIWLRQQGEAYYANGLKDINDDRRLSILAVCVIEWEAMIIDTILDTHDRIIGRLHNECKRIGNERTLDQKKLIKETIADCIQVTDSLLQEYDTNKSISNVIKEKEKLENLLIKAKLINSNITSEPLDFVLSGYNRVRRYSKRMLEDINFEGNLSAQHLLEAITVLKGLNLKDETNPGNLSIKFANQKWRKILGSKPNRKIWEMAVLFTIRDALRSRDIWVPLARKYQDTRTKLLPLAEAKQSLSGSMPKTVEEWIASRKELLDNEIKRVSLMIQSKELPGNLIDKGKINLERLKRDVPKGVDEMTLEIYREIPDISITKIIKEVDSDTSFTEAFTHLHTGSPCSDKIGLLNVLLSDGINLGLKKMALCSSSHGSFWTLMRISNWYINSKSSKEALSVIMEAQKGLPLSSIWGGGKTSSSDGQFFPAGGTGEAMNIINARYGKAPGVKAYTHISDQYAPFAMQTIPATAHEAPYIIDGLTMNDIGKKIKEHYADTGGFTDHVFAVSSLLGYEFAPRLRNLSSLRLYKIDGVNVRKPLQEIITEKIKINHIINQWPDIVRLIASIEKNKIVPSETLRQLASFPRQNQLSSALKEIGKIERTIFILKWISSVQLQKRAQMGLNKGEAHHALKRALNFNRKGEIRDRFSENQHLRMMNLNLLAAIIIYWNTKHIGLIIEKMKRQGVDIHPSLLSHLSPLGWEHIIMTGLYKW